MSEDPHSKPPDKPPPKGMLSLFWQYWNYGVLATLHMIIHDILYLLCASLLGTMIMIVSFNLCRPEFVILVALVPSLLVGLPVGGGIFITALPAIWLEKTILEQYSEAPSDGGTIPDQPRIFLEWATWWGRGAAALIHCLIPKIFLITPGAAVVLAIGVAVSSRAEYGHAIFLGLLMAILLPAVTGHFFLQAFPLLWDEHVIRAAFQPRPVIKKFRPDLKKMKFPKPSSGRVKSHAKEKRKKAPKRRKSAPSSDAKAKSDDAG